MIVKPIKTTIFIENGNLLSFVEKNIKKLPEKSILVVTSKIVALAEGSTVKTYTKKEKLEIIKQESDAYIKTKLTSLTLKDGMLMAASGVDESNANGKLILLPKDSFQTADFLYRSLKKKYRLKKFGILITDSRTFPLRQGVTGIALGFAGFNGIRDYRGLSDIFGRKFIFSTTNIADCLATSAVLVMGEGNEKQPLALIENAPIEFTNKKMKKDSISITIEDDLYKPLLQSLIKRIKKR